MLAITVPFTRDIILARGRHKNTLKLFTGKTFCPLPNENTRGRGDKRVTMECESTQHLLIVFLSPSFIELPPIENDENLKEDDELELKQAQHASRE